MTQPRFIAFLQGLALAAGMAGALVPASAQAQDAQTLHARHASLQPALAASPFKRPLLLQANNSSDAPHGDVYSIVDHGFPTLSGALQAADHWCDMLLLQFNVKRCVPSGRAPEETLHVAIGRKAEQPAKDAFPVDFSYRVLVSQPDYLAVQMKADEGPFGTRDYRLTLQAVPLDKGHSFIHLSYSYANGLAARLATQAYLATAGRHKVGFTVVGRDGDGSPQYVKGMQGIAERNTMRYFLAIDAFLDTLGVPAPQQAEQRLKHWFSATELYPQQLHELPWQEYLAMKRREMNLAQAPGAPVDL
ncbi:hypothetical protein [Ideonella sp. YS5]|uniref:hypothetical protein n=1 Tax=Ideonella sp. YS5 TaxID=3453714 RepID=UPI003EE94427